MGRRAWLRAANHGVSKARVTSRYPSAKITSLKSLSFWSKCFRSTYSDETIPLNRRNHFSLSSRHPEQPLVISYQRSELQRFDLNRRRPMRTISFILGFAFILAGPSIAVSSDGSLPGIGTFSYTSSPALTVVAGN